MSTLIRKNPDTIESMILRITNTKEPDHAQLLPVSRR